MLAAGGRRTGAFPPGAMPSSPPSLGSTRAEFGVLFSSLWEVVAPTLFQPPRFLSDDGRVNGDKAKVAGVGSEHASAFCSRPVLPAKLLTILGDFAAAVSGNLVARANTTPAMWPVMSCRKQHHAVRRVVEVSGAGQSNGRRKGPWEKPAYHSDYVGAQTVCFAFTKTRAHFPFSRLPWNVQGSSSQIERTPMFT